MALGLPKIVLLRSDPFMGSAVRGRLRPEPWRRDRLIGRYRVRSGHDLPCPRVESNPSRCQWFGVRPEYDVITGIEVIADETPICREPRRPRRFAFSLLFRNEVPHWE